MLAIRTIVLGGLVTAALHSAAAPASTLPVIQAIRAQDKIVRHSSEYKSLQHIKASISVAQAKAAIPKLNSLEVLLSASSSRSRSRSLDRAAATVSRAPASNAQRTGRSDWVKGTRLLADWVGGVAAALRDVVDGDKESVKAALRKAQRELSAANTIGEKGDRLLGLPTTA
jgi:hypothetical protein